MPRGVHRLLVLASACAALAAGAFPAASAAGTTSAADEASAADQASAAGAVDARVAAALVLEQPRIIAWRRDLHEHPELSNRETRTAQLVADHLRKLGLAVDTGLAHTGVVGVLKGGKPGPVVMLRADMDALPVVEETDVPFKSRVTSTYRGETVGVMHACGHDAHTAMLMGLAQVFSAQRAALPGTIVFLFQPAEEGAPPGEEGGASLLLKEGLLEKYRPQAVFGLHVETSLRVGQIGYRPGPFMAASDAWRIVVHGRGAHGSRPWISVDPIVISAQIINSLQTIVSRQVDITLNPAVVTVGAIKGGVRNNIIPSETEMVGTLRTFDPQQRKDILERMERTAKLTAQASGATATFEIATDGNPVLYNDPDLTARSLPALRRAAGTANVRETTLQPPAEDFAFYAQKVPSFYFFVGVTPADRDPRAVPSNHSPQFYLDEAGLPLAERALSAVVVDYLFSAQAAQTSQPRSKITRQAPEDSRRQIELKRAIVLPAGSVTGPVLSASAPESSTST
jgi:amidohydrolase